MMGYDTNNKAYKIYDPLKEESSLVGTLFFNGNQIRYYISYHFPHSFTSPSTAKQTKGSKFE